MDDIEPLGRTAPQPTIITSQRGRVAAIGALVLVGVVLTALVARWQVVSRSPLVWDEARRVQPGVEFTRAVATHSLTQVFAWANAQTFYPFLSSLASGLVLWFGGSFTAAAWLPVLVGFLFAGLIAAALARAVGLSRVATIAAAGLVWTTPLMAKLAGGGFTEPLGACLSLAVLLALALLRSKPNYSAAVLSGLVTGVATTLKYDYGILLFSVLCLSEALRVNSLRTWKSTRVALTAAGTALAVNAVFFSANTAGKVAGVKEFVRGSSGDSNASFAKTLSRIDFVAYPRQLFTSAEIGLSPVVAVAMFGGIVLAVKMWRSRPQLQPLLLFSALWWAMYSLGGAKYPRYTGTILPVLCVFAAFGIDTLVAAVKTRGATSWAPAACWALLALVLSTQLPQASQKFDFLKADEPVEQVLAFLRANLRPSDRPLLLVGMSNELSPELIHLTWDDSTGRRNGGAQTVGEAPTRKRRSQFLSTLAASGPTQILVITFDRGSRIDTADYRSHFASQSTYARLVRAQENEGAFTEARSYTTDRGRLHVRLLTVAGQP